MSEGKSPWAKRFEGRKLDETEKKMIEEVDRRMTEHPPLFYPAIWRDASEETRSAVMEVNCALNHLFSLADLTLQEKTTYLLEKVGSLIGEKCETPEQIASTLSALVSQAVEAGREFYSARRTQEVLDKIFSGHMIQPETKGEPN